MHPLVETSLFRLTILASVVGGAILFVFVCWLLARRNAAGRAWLKVRTNAFKAWRQELRQELAEPGARYLWATFGALVVPIYLFLRYPPFFNSSDAVSMYSWSLASHVPHWKPLYLLFIRGVNMIMEGALNFKLEAPVLWESVGVVVLVQQLVAIASLVVLSVTLASKKRSTLSAALLLGWVSPLFFFNHGIYLSSLVLSGIGFIAASCIMIARCGRLTPMAALVGGFGMLLSFSVRHDSIVYCVLPLLVACGLTLLRKNRMRLLLQVFKLTAVLILSIQACHTAVYWALGDSPGVIGRPGVSFMAESHQPDSSAEGSVVMAKMIESANDETVKKAIPIVFEEAPKWSNAYGRIRDMISYAYEDSVVFYDLQNPKVDHILNSIFFLYVKTNPERYLLQVWRNFQGYLFFRGWSGAPLERFDLVLVNGSLKFMKKAQASSLFEDSFVERMHTYRYSVATSDPLFVFMGFWTPFRLILVGLAVGVLCFVRIKENRIWPCFISFQLCAVGHLLLISILSANLEPRIASSSVWLLTISLAIPIVSLFDRSLQRKNFDLKI